MKRKDLVCHELERLTLTLTRDALIQSSGGGLDAVRISTNLGLARNSVSKELNELCLEKKVIKIKSRPVLFLHRAACEILLGQAMNDDQLQIRSFEELIPLEVAERSPFEAIIGYDRSLRMMVDKGKAAVLYPGGLHVLLTGSSGVGKTFFAEIMHQYACQALEQEMPLVYFNCAEYAHNPELLSSHLFGHKQGAFTGASESKRGLIEQANGGFLLLDEVHRLSYEGQEKLFSILDKGEYRPLGSSAQSQAVRIRLICATTEQADSTLLRTFLRRIQVAIAIPALRQRSLEEQVELITGFLQRESRKIDRTIRIDKALLLYLLEKPLEGNIGQLKSDIQFLCAQAWASGMGQQNSELLLDKRLVDGRLPASNAATRLRVDALFGSQDQLDISGGPLPALLTQLALSGENEDSDLFYTYLTREYVNLRNSNVPPQETLSILKNKLRSIFEYGLYSHRGAESGERVYGGQVEQRITVLTECVQQVVGFDLPQNLVSHLRKHILALLSYVQRGTIPNLYSSSLIHDYCKDEYEHATGLCRKIDEIFHIQCPSTEIVFLCLFLKECRNCRQRKDENPECGVILIAHGATTATSMAQYVNRVLERELFLAIDMPFEQSVHDTLDLLINTLHEHSYQRLILIVDIGSLVHFGSTISKLFHLDVLLIQNITLSALIEVGMDLTYDTSEFAPLMALMEDKGIASHLCHQHEQLVGNVLVISYITGLGTAVKIKKVLEESFGELMSDDTRLVVVDYNDVRSMERLRHVIDGDERLVGIVGTFQPGLPDIPFIALEELFSEQGPELVLSLLNPDLSRAERRLEVERSSLRFISALTLESIINHISVLNPQRILQEMEGVLQQITQRLGLHPTRQVTLRFLIHCCCMVERIVLSHKPLQIPLNASQQSDPQIQSVIKAAFLPIEEAYSVRFSDTEYFYIYELLYR